MFNGLNIFGIMEISSVHILFKPFRVNYVVPGQETNGDNLGMSF